MLSQIYAIFIASLRLLLRKKAPAALIVVIALAGPVSSYYLFSADGTLTGVLRMVIMYNQYILATAVTLLTLYFSVAVLDSELTEDQMTLTASKPVGRWQVLVGKWLAVAVISGAALLLGGVAGYVVVQQRCSVEQALALRQNSPELQRSSREQRLADAREQVAQARQELLISRVPFRPQIPTVEEELRAVYARIKADGIPADKRPSDDEIRRAVLRQRKKMAFAIQYGTGREYQFAGLPQTTQPVTVRYCLNGTSSPGQLGWLETRWGFAGADTQAPFYWQTKARTGTTREFRIPGNLIPPSGQLRAVIINDIPPAADTEPQNIEVPLENGFNLMIPQGSFAANYARGLLLTWIRLLALAAVGVGASTFLSGSVSAFLLISLSVIGMLNGFVIEEMRPSETQILYTGVNTSFFNYVAVALLQMLPDFQLTSPVQALTTGTEISWWYLGVRAICDLLLRGGVVFGIGIYAFYRREIGVPRIFR